MFRPPRWWPLALPVPPRAIKKVRCDVPSCSSKRPDQELDSAISVQAVISLQLGHRSRVSQDRCRCETAPQRDRSRGWRERATARLAERYAFDAGQGGVGEASRSEGVEEADEASDDWDDEGNLEGAVSRLLVDAEDFCLHVFGFVGEQGFELWLLITSASSSSGPLL
jgi:hypothetical protein